MTEFRYSLDELANFGIDVQLDILARRAGREDGFTYWRLRLIHPLLRPYDIVRDREPLAVIVCFVPSKCDVIHKTGYDIFTCKPVPIETTEDETGFRQSILSLGLEKVLGLEGQLDVQLPPYIDYDPAPCTDVDADTYPLPLEEAIKQATEFSAQLLSTIAELTQLLEESRA